MIAYVVRRILLVVPIALAAFTVIFVVMRTMPGDPALAILGDAATHEAVEELREQMGLNDSLIVQYVSFFRQIARGDLGRSARSNTPIAAYVSKVLPHTLVLTAGGIIVGSVLGIPLGILTALRRNSLADYVGRVLSLAGASIPAFSLGVLLLVVFSVELGLLPVVGVGRLGDPMDMLRHLVLPVLTLGLIMTAYITRVARSAMLGILNEEYMQTARAKGLKERLVIYKHGLRNALIPIVAFAGVYAVVLLGNAVTVEIVFSRPGLGRLLVDAAKDRDIMVLQSVMLIFAGLVILCNLATDVIYGFIDPRIQYN